MRPNPEPQPEPEPDLAPRQASTAKELAYLRAKERALATVPRDTGRITLTVRRPRRGSGGCADNPSASAPASAPASAATAAPPSDEEPATDEELLHAAMTRLHARAETLLLQLSLCERERAAQVAERPARAKAAEAAEAAFAAEARRLRGAIAVARRKAAASRRRRLGLGLG